MLMYSRHSDAIIYFIRDMSPQIKQKSPGIKLYVIGRGPTRDIIDDAKKDSDIIVTGEVDDVRDHLKKATVFIAPIRLGKGFRGKSLEVMAMGIPVVTTSLGAEGIEYIDMKNLAIADSAESFIDKTMQLLNDEAPEKQ